MFNDFNEDTENFNIDLNKLSGYLLGNIVLIRAQQDTNLASQFEVIDGQQRLTTLTLIFALYILSSMNYIVYIRMNDGLFKQENLVNILEY